MKVMQFLAVCLFALATVVTTQVIAANYPKDLYGIWTSGDPNTCNKNANSHQVKVISIHNKNRGTAGETCSALKVTGKNGAYTIKEECSLEGETAKGNIKYKRDGNTLTVGSGKYATKYQKCQ